MADQKKRERADSTEDAALDAVEQPHGAEPDTLDALLGGLEEEVERERARPLSSMPPPLPHARGAATKAAPKPRASRAKAPTPGASAPTSGSAGTGAPRPTASRPRPIRPSSTAPPPRPVLPPTAPSSLPPRPASSMPPPLPPRSPSGRPPTQTNLRSVPPPPPPGARARVRGLGRPASIPPPRIGHPTAPGMPAPPEPDSEERTRVAVREVDEPALRLAARELADAWEAELSGPVDRARKARLAYELGRLYEGPLRDLNRAWTSYQTALSCAPDHLPSLRGARRVAIARKDHRAALPLFDAEARITADSRRKAALLYAKARILEDALGEKDKAREILATAAELDRKDASILKALEQRDLEKDDVAKLERTLEREANAVAADPRHRAALIVERARLLEHREKRVDAAIELYETALKLDPNASGALDALERLCHAHGRWRELIRTLERKAEQSGDPTERALALYHAGRTHAERLGNRDEAIALLERAAAESPNDPLVLEELAALYERAERYEPLAGVLARIAELSGDPAERLATWHRIGQVFDERLGKPEEARRAYERALALDP
ncbi:MAG TPA: tetratricopeptide repeat protein, partial [Sandaracinaceae bacterium]